MTIQFEKPIEGILHVIEHPCVDSDPPSNDTTPRQIGRPGWRLLFVQETDRLMVGTRTKEVPNYSYTQEYKTVIGTSKKLVYGFIEPEESALKRMQEDLEEARNTVRSAHDHSRQQANKIRELESEAIKLQNRVEEESAGRLRAQLLFKEECERSASFRNRLREMENEMAAVRTHFGAAAYYQAIKSSEK